MRRVLLLSLLLVAVLPAQVQVTATGMLHVHWDNGGGWQSHSLPVSGALTTLRVSGIGTASLATGSTTTISVQAGAPQCCGYHKAAGGYLLVTYTAPAPIAGVLTLQMNPTCLIWPPYIDVNDDGTWELGSGGGTATVPVVLGPTPVKARIHAHTLNWGGATCAYTASITFTPNATQLQTVQPPCGPFLSATLQRATLSPPANGELRLHVGDMTGAIGVLFVGTTLTPGVACGPASSAEASMLITPDPAGVSIPLVIPPAALGVFSLQYVDVVFPLQLHWSNAVQVTLP